MSPTKIVGATAEPSLSGQFCPEPEPTPAWAAVPPPAAGEPGRSPYTSAADSYIAAQRQTYQACLDQSSPGIIRDLHGLLLKRGIPLFYYHRNAKEQGLTIPWVNQWKLESYPCPSPKAGEDSRKLMELVLKTWLDTNRYPKPDTHQEAVAQLRQRVADLKDQDLSHNRIAQILHISHRALSDLLNPDHPNPRYCPWHSLEILQDVKPEDYRPAAKPLTQYHDELTEDFFDLHEERANLLKLTNNIKVIHYGAACARCCSRWTNLRREADHEWLESPIFTCILCGQEHILQEDSSEQQQRRYAKPYSDCWECGAPAHNLRHNRTDPNGDKAYECTACGAQTWVAAADL